MGIFWGSTILLWNFYFWSTLAKRGNFWLFLWLQKPLDNSALYFKVGCYPKEKTFQNRTGDQLLLWFHMRLSDQRNLYHIPNDIIDYLDMDSLWLSTYILHTSQTVLLEVGYSEVWQNIWIMTLWIMMVDRALFSNLEGRVQDAEKAWFLLKS